MEKIDHATLMGKAASRWNESLAQVGEIATPRSVTLTYLNPAGAELSVVLVRADLVGDDRFQSLMNYCVDTVAAVYLMAIKEEMTRIEAEISAGAATITSLDPPPDKLIPDAMVLEKPTP